MRKTTVTSLNTFLLKFYFGISLCTLARYHYSRRLEEHKQEHEHAEATITFRTAVHSRMGDDHHHSLTSAASQKFHILWTISQFLQVKNFPLHCFVAISFSLHCHSNCFFSSDNNHWAAADPDYPHQTWSWSADWLPGLATDLSYLTWTLDQTCLMVWTLSATWLPPPGLPCLSCSGTAGLWSGQRGTSPADCYLAQLTLPQEAASHHCSLTHVVFMLRNGLYNFDFQRC